MNASSSQQASASLIGSMKSQTLVKEQETDGGIRLVRRENSGSDVMDYYLLSEVGSRQVWQVPISHSIKSIILGETTQEDINEMVSQCFATHCDKYYRRCCLLTQLIAADNPSDTCFLGVINSGPMFATDCCRYLGFYVNKFGRDLFLENTVLREELDRIVEGKCPPMDIYEQEPFLDVVSRYHYAVVEGGKATDALSALKNKFSIIDANMLCEMAYYEVVMLLIGEKNFNMIFERGAKKHFSISSQGIVRGAINGLMSSYSVADNDDPTQKYSPPLTAKKGTLYYVSNHEDYKNKHPFCVASGFHCMLVNKADERLYFTTFGVSGCGLKPNEISEKLVRLFNRPTVYDFNNNAVFSKIKELWGRRYDEVKNKIITLDDFYANKGGWWHKGQKNYYLDINEVGGKFEYLFLMDSRVTYRDGNSQGDSQALSVKNIETTV